MEHIVKSFDKELATLDRMIAELGGLAETQIAAAMNALVKRDAEKAELVRAADIELDKLEEQINEQVVRLLALRHPVAEDLRLVVAALKISNDLERIGDYAKNIAKRTPVIAQSPPLGALTSLRRMGSLVTEMIKDVLDAYLERDGAKALDVRQRDEEVDALHTSLFRELLTYMAEDHRSITPSTHLLFIAKNIERVGDLTTNVAEQVHYMVSGEIPADIRPKLDDSAVAGLNHESLSGIGGA